MEPSAQAVPTHHGESSDTRIPDEPAGMEDVREQGSTLGAATEGGIPDEDLEQARLRMHDAQVALMALGYGPGGELEGGPDDLTGRWGPETREAVASFQQDRDLPVTGQLDLETYQALMAEYETAMETQAREPRQDPFDPVRADEPLQDERDRS